MNKTKDIKEYRDWLKDHLNVTIDKNYENYFNLITPALKDTISNYSLIKNLNKQLRAINDEYEMLTTYPLLNYNQPIEFFKKGFDAFFMKTYRKNILNNHNFPEPPSGGWFTPDNWFERINDIIRTSISVKYLDGVKFIIEKLEKLSNENAFEFKSNYEAKEEGYYAAHTYLKKEIEIPAQKFNTVKINFEFEIQITTQLQEVIKTLLHKHYEENRKKENDISYKWQWDYKSTEFSANYLGHILHYVEGMIMEIRTKQNKSK